MNKLLDYLFENIMRYDTPEASEYGDDVSQADDTSQADDASQVNDTSQVDDVSQVDDASQVDDVDDVSQADASQADDAENIVFLLLIVFLQTHTRLFEVIEDLSCLDNLETTYILIKGAVQSGKSEIIHALVLYLTIRHQHNVTIILRNYTGDYDQMDRGLVRFIELFQNFLIQKAIEDTETLLPHIFYIGDIIRSKVDGKMSHHESLCHDLVRGGSITLSLANTDQMIKMNECWDIVEQENADLNKMSVIIDEADQLMHAEGEKFTPQLDQFLSNAKNIIGISATHYECLHDQKNRFSTDNVYILTPPPNYKGISDVQFQYIEPIDSKMKSGNPSKFLEWDKELNNFLLKNGDHQPFSIHNSEKHPMLTLIKHERTTTNQHKMLEEISKHPEFGKQYTCIVYNGTEVILYSHRLMHEKIVLPICRKREIANKSKDGKHVFASTSIGYVLQYLKNNGGAEKYPRILIIAHNLVGRGINVVSNDFKWHLTHMYYRPSSTSNASTLIQSMRIFGIYNDSIPLVCVLEKKVYDDLYRAYMLHEDMFSKLSKTEDEKPISEWLKCQHVYIEKVPRRDVSKCGKFGALITDELAMDDGMIMTDFNRNHCITKMPVQTTNVVVDKNIDDTEYERLANDRNGMFKKWSSISNQSAIARFMRDGLDPFRKYTKKEITDVCKEYGIILKYLTISHTNKKSKGGVNGQILCCHNNHYFVYPQLINSFEKYF